MIKIKAILGSIRFWLLTLAMGGELANLSLAGSLSIDSTFIVVQTWLIAVVALGTLDSVATKISK